jgi:hypothetical protein
MSGPAINARVSYKSFAGDTWSAIVTAMPIPGFVDLDVEMPGVKEPYHLSAIRWYDDPLEKSPGARPRAIVDSAEDIDG